MKRRRRRGSCPQALLAEGLLVSVALVASLGSAMASLSEGVGDDDFPRKETVEAAMLRGEIAFRNYCTLCHGSRGDGRGRGARLYNPRPANLRESLMTDQYKESIIRLGGRAMGRSAFMPPWGQELTDEQIADLVVFLRSIAPPGAPQ